MKDKQSKLTPQKLDGLYKSIMKGNNPTHFMDKNGVHEINRKDKQTESLEEFDKRFANAGGDYDGSLEPIKDFIRENFISKEELRGKINKIKETVQKQTGSFKYDSCYDDILNIIK